MNTTSLFVKQILTTIGICIILFLETSVGNAQLPNPEIKSGTARVSGKVLYYQEAVNISPTVFLIVFNPLTAEKGRTYETVLKKDGSFYFEVPVECNYTLGYFGLAMIGLAAGEETRLEVIPHATDPTINMTGSIKFVSYDALNINKVLQKVIYDSPRPPDSVFVKVKCPEDFVYNSMIRLDDKLMLVENETGLSEIAKRHIMREIKLVMLDGRFLKYQQLMHIDYLNSLPAEERDKAREHYVRPPEPGRSYYSFLKYFDLNDPQYLYCETYPLVLRTLLANETLNIPDIGDTPVDKWLKGVKAILSDLVGSDTGLFYEMLASIAYSKQFINGLRPLSDRQKENITRYFKNKEISKILLKKNEEILLLHEEKSPLVIHETPTVPKEKLLETIVSKYKGKTVVVDFWATWCGPCLDAMTECRKVKKELKEKDVVFVYISNHSSPQKLWKEKVEGIGGEHYYLNGDEWEYIFDQLDVTSIPQYLFYDKEGNLKNKVTGFPGAEKMKQMIDELMNEK